jgi:hypothetical protein
VATAAWVNWHAMAEMASSPADSERMGLSAISFAPWAVGARTDDSTDTYHWCHFHKQFADGAKHIATWTNKEIAERQKPLSPPLGRMRRDPSGCHFSRLMQYWPGERSTATSRSDGTERPGSTSAA